MNKRILISVAALFFCINLGAQEIKIIEGPANHNLDPQTTSVSSDAQILSGLYEGLFSYHPVTLEPLYAIAIDYKLSRDKKRWSFTLRQNAKFSNGEPITAKSVRDSWLMLISNPYGAYSSAFDIIDGAQEFREGTGSAENVRIYANDDYSLSIYLKTPASYLPKLLCHHAFAVVHQNPVVSSGAFYISDMTATETLLAKNPYYWDAENVLTEQIRFVQSADEVENTFKFNNGECDWIQDKFLADKILNKNAIQYVTEFATTYFFFKNTVKKPAAVPGEFCAWNYPEFRNAILEAFPWDSFRGPFTAPATTFVYPLTGYPEVEGFTYTDPIEADVKMQQAREKYGVPADMIIPLRFQLMENSLTEETIELLKKSFEPLGVQAEFTFLPVYEYFSSVGSSSADLYCYSWIGDYADPLAFLELFRGGSTMNDSGWKNDEFDSLLDQSNYVSELERYQLLSKAETILLDSGMVIPLTHPLSLNIINTECITGWANNAFDIHPLKYLNKKEVIKKIPNLVKR